jgi:hypothetical protein
MPRSHFSNGIRPSTGAGAAFASSPGVSPAELHRLAGRVRSEFLEMPGLRLTIPQAARLWGLDLESCHAVVDVLLESAFLRRAAGGTVTRSE